MTQLGGDAENTSSLRDLKIMNNNLMMIFVNRKALLKLFLKERTDCTGLLITFPIYGTYSSIV